MASKTGVDGRTFSNRRRAALRRIRKRAGSAVDAALITRPVDVGYLSGFSGEDSVLLVGKGFAVLVTDGRYDEQASGECPGVEICVRSEGMIKAIGQQVRSRKLTHLAIQSDHVTLGWSEQLGKEVGNKRLKPVRGGTLELRETKDDSEIAATRRAIRAAEKAMRDLLAGGRKAFVGRSEREVAGQLEYLMRRHGASGASFDTIVAAGPHGSLPHYRPGDTKIRKDQAVLVDWGAVVDGYCSDLTRVVFTGRIPPKIAEVYQVVLRAQRAAISSIRPGVAGKTVDAAAREVIASAGYADRFTHGLGHGVGREIHEAPSVGRTSDVRLRSGMVVTVEPGIYLPGVGGVRIEDDVLVTPDGAKKLSSLPRSMEAMVLP